MPEDAVSMVDGRVFVKLTARHNAVRRMMTVHTTGTADESAVDKLVYTVLGRTDVIKAVIKPAVASAMVDRLVPDEHHRLRKSKRINFHSKVVMREINTAGDTIAATMPQVGPIEPVTILMMAGVNPGTPSMVVER